MDQFDFGGGMGGAASGAMLGSYFMPGIGTAIGAGAGGLLGGLMGGGRKNTAPDISAALAQINALFQAQKDYATKAAGIQLGELNKRSASDLAARGVYSSPVSQYSFDANSKATNQSLMEALAGISGHQAATTSGLMGQLMGYQQTDRINQANARNQIFGSLGSIGATLLANKNDGQLLELLKGMRSGGGGGGLSNAAPYYLAAPGAAFSGPSTPGFAPRLF